MICGADDRSHLGVAVLLRARMFDKVTQTHSDSGRVMAVDLNLHDRFTDRVVAAYAPHAGYVPADLQTFYNDLHILCADGRRSSRY